MIQIKINKRIILSILFTFFFIISSMQTLSSSYLFENEQNNILNNSNRWDINGVIFILLNGSFYEMGYQQATLLKDEILKNMRAFEHFYNSEGIYYEDLLELWGIQKDFIPQKVLDFIKGTSDALDLPFEKMGTVWVAEGFSYTLQCCGMAAWGDATEDGDLIALRSMEFPLDIQDPITGDYIQESPVIVIAKPDDGNAFVYPTFAGYSIEDGINEKGISIINNWSPNDENNDYGTPMGVRIFESLYNADTAEEAVKIMTSNRTYGYNFVISDFKTPIGYAIETSVNYSYIGCWDNSTESIRPFRPIKDVVRRCNIFLNEQTAKTQRDVYNPRHPKNILNLIIYQIEEPWYYLWVNYKAFSTGINSIWGEMNLNNTLSMCRQMYRGGYNHIWNVLLKIIPKLSWWQWVVKPSTGEMYISFASGDKCAFDTEILKFNYLKSLEDNSPFIIN